MATDTIVREKQGGLDKAANYGGAGIGIVVLIMQFVSPMTGKIENIERDIDGMKERMARIETTAAVTQEKVGYLASAYERDAKVK